MSLHMRNPTICICKNKAADQLRSNCKADQRLCFRFTDSTIPLLSKFEILSLQLFSVAVQPSLCRICSETQIVGFLTHRLNYFSQGKKSLFCGQEDAASSDSVSENRRDAITSSYNSGVTLQDSGDESQTVSHQIFDLLYSLKRA